jgi:hypothetical protein
MHGAAPGRLCKTSRVDHAYGSKKGIRLGVKRSFQFFVCGNTMNFGGRTPTILRYRSLIGTQERQVAHLASWLRWVMRCRWLRRATPHPHRGAPPPHRGTGPTACACDCACRAGWAFAIWQDTIQEAGNVSVGTRVESHTAHAHACRCHRATPAPPRSPRPASQLSRVRVSRLTFAKTMLMGAKVHDKLVSACPAGV